MKYCMNCGAQLPDRAGFCGNCGASVSSFYDDSRSSRRTVPSDPERERREAIEAGNRALSSLYAAQDELNKARNWGVVDLLGGGLITSMIKRSKISNAQSYMDQAREDLRRFRMELSDVSSSGRWDLGADDFLDFADWFFDGFVVDFLVQSKINTARKQIAEAISRVESILHRLQI